MIRVAQRWRRKRRISGLLARIVPANRLTLDEFERVCERLGLDSDKALSDPAELAKAAQADPSPTQMQEVLDAIVPGNGIRLARESIEDASVIAGAAVASFVFASALRSGKQVPKSKR